MTIELTLLMVGCVWGYVQLTAAAQSANAQYGLKWAASPRDADMPPLKPIPGRINRNFRNYLETFPFFVAAILIAHLSATHNAFTVWGAGAYLVGRIGYTVLYVTGVPLIRSLFWNSATFGVFAILYAPFAAH